MGTQTWLAITIVLTEALIVFKFDWDLVSKPFPRHVIIGWSIFLTGLILWMLWHFYLKPHLNRQEKKISNRKAE
jgi:hypothetical protein